MPVFSDENELATHLQTTLKPRYKEVYANVNLASHRFYQDWEKWWGTNPPIAQPQIDLILVSSDLRLHAVELKYYRPTKTAPANWPYYSGIDEALALLKFGVFSSSLWHFFDFDVPEDTMKSYFRDCWEMITALGLRVWYKAFRVHTPQDIKEMARMSYTEQTPDFTPYSSNPLVNNTHAMRAADFIRKALHIPTPP